MNTNSVLSEKIKKKQESPVILYDLYVETYQTGIRMSIICGIPINVDNNWSLSASTYAYKSNIIITGL